MHQSDANHDKDLATSAMRLRPSSYINIYIYIYKNYIYFYTVYPYVRARARRRICIKGLPPRVAGNTVRCSLVPCAATTKRTGAQAGERWHSTDPGRPFARPSGARHDAQSCRRSDLGARSCSLRGAPNFEGVSYRPQYIPTMFLYIYIQYTEGPKTRAHRKTFRELKVQQIGCCELMAWGLRGLWMLGSSWHLSKCWPPQRWLRFGAPSPERQSSYVGWKMELSSTVAVVLLRCKDALAAYTARKIRQGP